MSDLRWFSMLVSASVRQLVFSNTSYRVTLSTRKSMLGSGPEMMICVLLVTGKKIAYMPLPWFRLAVVVVIVLLLQCIALVSLLSSSQWPRKKKGNTNAWDASTYRPKWIIIIIIITVAIVTTLSPGSRNNAFSHLKRLYTSRQLDYHHHHQVLRNHENAQYSRYPCLPSWDSRRGNSKHRITTSFLQPFPRLIMP